MIYLVYCYGYPIVCLFVCGVWKNNCSSCAELFSHSFVFGIWKYCWNIWAGYIIHFCFDGITTTSSSWLNTSRTYLIVFILYTPICIPHPRREGSCALTRFYVGASFNSWLLKWVWQNTLSNITLPYWCRQGVLPENLPRQSANTYFTSSFVSRSCFFYDIYWMLNFISCL